MNVLLCFKTDSLSGKLMLKQVLKMYANSVFLHPQLERAACWKQLLQVCCCWDPIVGTVNSSNSGSGKDQRRLQCPEEIQESQTHYVGLEAEQYQRFLIKSEVKDFLGHITGFEKEEDREVIMFILGVLSK